MSTAVGDRSPGIASEIGWHAVVLVVAAFIGVASTSPGAARVGIASVAAMALITIVMWRPAAALYGYAVWLAALGTIRRGLTGVTATGEADALLVVGPIALAAMALVACHRGALKSRTGLTHAVLVLGGVIALSVVNPAQGPLRVGLGGAMLVLTPILGFLVGRTLADQELVRVLWIYGFGAILVATYGLAQTFVGFPSWDQRWIDDAGYGALSVAGVVRAFASFSSASEYVMYLVIGVVCWLTIGRSSRLRMWALPVVVLLLVAIWFESSRGAVLLLLVAVGAMGAARVRLSLGASLLTGACVVGVAAVAIDQLAPRSFSTEPGALLSAHQVEGLTNPLGEGSTLPLKISLVTDGVTSVVAHPLGAGVGSVTIAASRFSGSSLGTDAADPGNVANAAGVVGLLAYAVVLVLGVRTAHRCAVVRQDALGFAALGGLLATALSWLNGGRYAVAFVPWLLLGWLGRADQPDTAVR